MGNRYYNAYSLCEKIFSSMKFNATCRNFHDDRIIFHWKDIFGEFADKMQPCNIVFSGIDSNNITKKVLYVSTFDRAFASEFIFYKKQLIDKLNIYFGTEKSIFVDIKVKTL